MTYTLEDASFVLIPLLYEQSSPLIIFHLMWFINQSRSFKNHLYNDNDHKEKTSMYSTTLCVSQYFPGYCALYVT